MGVMRTHQINLLLITCCHFILLKNFILFLLSNYKTKHRKNDSYISYLSACHYSQNLAYFHLLFSIPKNTTHNTKTLHYLLFNFEQTDQIVKQIVLMIQSLSIVLIVSYFTF